MRFILMHKHDKSTEAGIPPSMELIGAMGKFMSEALDAGVFLTGEGLGQSSKRSRLNFSASQCTLIDGPFSGSNELIAGLVMVKVKSKEEAIKWAGRLAKVLVEGEIEVSQVTEPCDLGMGPKPEGAPLRFLLLHKADHRSEAGGPAALALSGAITKLTEEMQQAGVLLLAEGLQPSSKGARLTISGGKRTVVDGPFTESKELIGGFAMVQLKAKQDAIEFATAFAKVLLEAKAVGDIEIDVRPIA